MFGINVNLTAEETSVLGELQRGLSGDRTELHSFMAPPIEARTVSWLQGLGGTRHATANALGATPTGFLTSAAGTVQARGTADGVELAMQSAGLSRAFRDYDLRPVRAKYLTIPVRAEAYGKRAREFDLKPGRATLPDGTAGPLSLGTVGADGSFTAFFRLVKKAHQPADRTLLPGDDDWLAAAEDGAVAWWNYHTGEDNA